MMFEATVQINNVDEYNLFALFMSNLVEMRKKTDEVVLDRLPNKPTPTQQAKLDAAIAKAEETFPENDTAVVGNIGTPDATITDTRLTEAFTRYAPGKKVEDLKALLAKYDATRVAGIAQKRRAEFLSEIGG